MAYRTSLRQSQVQKIFSYDYGDLDNLIIKNTGSRVINVDMIEFLNDNHPNWTQIKVFPFTWGLQMKIHDSDEVYPYFYCSLHHVLVEGFKYCLVCEEGKVAKSPNIREKAEVARRWHF